jgi:hypothetical protein
MHTDIYLTIGLYLPIPSILNYLLAKKVNREYFWKARCHRDYSLTNPLNLSYSKLYRMHYKFTLGKATTRLLPPPTTQLNHVTPDSILKGLSKQPVNGEIIILRFHLRMDDWYIFHNNALIEFDNVIPVCIDVINRYPINYFDNIGRYIKYELDLTLYLPQIRDNQANANTIKHKYSSRFTDWRGNNYTIYYNNIEDLSKEGVIYTIAGDKIYLYGVPI